MSWEKKYWRLPTSFRRSSENQDLRPKSKTERGRGRLSSVYLSDDTGFIVAPEFDGAGRTQIAHEEPNTVSRLSELPGVTSRYSWSPNAPGGNSLHCDFEPTDFHCHSYYAGDSCNTSVLSPSEDDLTQRLGSAYEHIRSMSCMAPPKISLSSDPQMLRKQLGVPQHSVLNYPIHSYPDLPNPHASPLDPTASPNLQPTSPDASFEGVSKWPGLCINTNLYPTSPACGSPCPLQRSQSKSVVTVQAPTERSSFPSHTFEAPLNAQHGHARKSRPSVSNSSKLVKRRIERPVVSSPPSQPRKSVLRKPTRGTTRGTSQSKNAHTWQISLPLVRSPSPLQVDIPLHHTWHDRQANLSSCPVYRSGVGQEYKAKPQRTSGNTEVLASLAWIGSPPTRLSSCTADQTCQPEKPAFLLDRSSMAIIVEDESISDDALINRLEEVRRTCVCSERGRDHSPPMSSSCAPVPRRGVLGNGLPLTSSTPSSPPTYERPAEYRISSPSPPTMQHTPSDSDDSEVWKAARKALLCIREIIRTEKKYQEAIKMLLGAQTATPPPPSMTPYISALVRVSETLLKSLLEDPSAWGVSTAFVASEDELEVAMISWCTVAGTLFVDGNDLRSSGLIGRWLQRKSGMTSSPSSSITKQTSNSLSQPPSLSPTTNKTKEHVNDERPQTKLRKQTIPSELENGRSQIPTGQAPSRKLSVRDLAIQPIQRVVRYVLLYRDLQECTPPTSPSRLLVERALEAAMRIADRCDNAQRNPAFFRAS